MMNISNIILPESARNIELPKMVRVEQIFDDEYLDDIEGAVKAETGRFVSHMPEGSHVAVLTGSRGIKNIDIIVKTLIDVLKKAGTQPFIIPAMGSHGGGTSEGQLAVLDSYGINEDSMGVKIDASMETRVIGEIGKGIDVHFSKPALEADFVIPVGRVKAHTDFNGPIESGLCKMLAIGGGKHNGCSRLHREGFAELPWIIPDAAEVILENAPVIFGLAVIENAYERTHTIKAVDACDFMTVEPELLKLSKSLMPRIQFDEIDLLIIEQIGKDISGTGMDPNIIGRDSFGPMPDVKPYVKRILIEDLTEGAHGNAIGFGMADFILRKALDKIDLGATYTNGIASGNPNGMKIPVIADDEEQGIRAALQVCPGTDLNDPKIVRIKDTLHLSEIEVSENMLPLCADKKAFRMIG